MPSSVLPDSGVPFTRCQVEPHAQVSVKNGSFRSDVESVQRVYPHIKVQLNGYVNGTARSQAKFGLPSMRASYNERIHHRTNTQRILPNYPPEKPPRKSDKPEVIVNPHTTSPRVYRSNGSLDVEDTPSPPNTTTTSCLRRDYGSHGSIDALGSQANGESLHNMLQDTDNDYRQLDCDRIPDIVDANVSKTKKEIEKNGSDAGEVEDPMSPKVKNKFQKLFERDKNKMKGKSLGSEPSIFRKLRGSTKESRSEVIRNDTCLETARSTDSLDLEGRAEERLRRRAFTHHDCQSVAANLTYAARLRSLLSRRRNTTTGASAAAMAARSSGSGSTTPRGSVENVAVEDPDLGDGRTNDLILSCPFFRNEVGGEEERSLSLTRCTSYRPPSCPPRVPPTLHRPPPATAVSVLEFSPGTSFWKTSGCHFQRSSHVIEGVDHGAVFYQKYFYGRDHQNWFGLDDNLGPMAISIKRERLDEFTANKGEKDNPAYQYRLIIRTSELLTLRGSLLEEAVPTISPKCVEKSRTLPVRDVLEFVAPEIQLSCLRMATSGPSVEDQLMKLDQQGLNHHYKVGVLYCKAGQSSEEEMYNNEEAGPAFNEFLEMIGQRVRLKGFDKYKAGLDNKSDSTGLYSVYAQYQDAEVMFHVSTLLPFTMNNRQQLLRKRHVGNDIVTIVFQEPGALPFTPKNFRSHFQHVFIIVRVLNPCSENTQYNVAVSRSKEVPAFGPAIPGGATFAKSKSFAELLLAKAINAENAAHRSEKFVTMASRTRQEYLKDLASNYITPTTLEPSQKFSMNPFGSKKKGRCKPKFIPDASQRGAMSWPVVVEDCGVGTQVDCLLAISIDSLVIIDELNNEVVFASPCVSIIGLSRQNSSLRIYYHQGECLVVHPRSSMDVDELQEIRSRLMAVIPVEETKELSLRRNQMGQLGFHVQHDGLVTEVETYSLAWRAGLRQGSRIVEICKVAIATLNHDQMVDLLKTSQTVTVTVIPPLPNGSIRRGCNISNCSYLANGLEGDYENVSNNSDQDDTVPRQIKLAVRQQPHRGPRYDRSVSPPRSSNSSGYGTGSSSKSFFRVPPMEPLVPAEVTGTMSSTSSSLSASTAEPETGERLDGSPPPPPLPARSVPGSTGFSRPNQAQTVMETESNHSRLSASRSLDQMQVNNYATPPSYISPRPYPGYRITQELSQAELKPETRYSDYDNTSISVTSSSSPALLEPKNLDSKSTYLIDFPLEGPEQCVTYQPANEHHHLYKSASLPSEQLLSRNKQLVAVGSFAALETTQSEVADRLMGARSEDELSAGSGNISPHLRRRLRTGTSTPSSGSSRNQSPRTLKEGGGEARLRPIVSTRLANRNSANLVSSNLQEELLKLINPDYVSDTEQGRESSPQLSQLKGRDIVTSVGGGGGGRLARTKESSQDVVLMTARPATVISNGSTNSSPAPSEKQTTSDRQPNRCSYQNHTNSAPATQHSYPSQTNFTPPSSQHSYPGQTNSGPSNQHSYSSQISSAPSNQHSYAYQTNSGPSNQHSYPSQTNSGPSNQHNYPSQANSGLSSKHSYPGQTNLAPSSHHSYSSQTAPASTEKASNHLQSQRSHQSQPETDSRQQAWKQDLMRLSREERLSPRAKPTPPLSLPVKPELPLPVPDTKDIDWSSLVDTATRAMQDNETLSDGDRSGVAGGNSPSPEKVKDLQNRLLLLESELHSEQNKRETLESQVRRLSDDNHRLQEESKAAALQLRRFTEWFFQTIDKQ